MSNVLFSNQGITRVPQSKMLKSEMADYADRTIDIVRDFAPDMAQISPVFQLLLAKKPDIETLRLIYGIDTERKKVANLKGKLMLKVSALKLSVRLLKRSNTELDLHVIENTIKSYLRYLDKSKNDKQLTQRVEGFIDAVKSNNELSEAISNFDLDNQVLDIKAAHEAYNDSVANRVKLLSKRSKVSTREIVKGVFGAITNLFKAIEVGHLVSLSTPSDTGEEGVVNVDYVPLINELSQLSQMYNRSITIRTAINKRNAANEEDGQTDADADVGIDVEDDAPQTPDAETPTKDDATTATQFANVAAHQPVASFVANHPLEEHQEANEDLYAANADDK